MIAPEENVEKYAKISAVSYDNLVECFELDNKKFIMGIKCLVIRVTSENRRMVYIMERKY